MAFERNDIVVKTKLADALGEELMGFEHNDIVTTDVMNAAIAGGGGGGDFGTAKVTFEIGSGVCALEYMSQIDFPPLNPDTSSQYQYGALRTIGNTQDPAPRPEIENTQEDFILTYQGIAYLGTPKIYSCETGDEITVSDYTLSGAAEIVEDEESPLYGWYKVTGDCTVTLTRE